MGIDLTLCPVRHDHGKDSGSILVYTRLDFNMRDYDLWKKIQAEAIPLGVPVSWYMDQGIEDVTEDPYGSPLTFITAHRLLKIIDEHFKSSDELWIRSGNRGHWDLGCLAFIRALNPDRRIILWWH